MNLTQTTIRRTFLTGLFIGLAMFVVMALDYFLNQAEFIALLSTVFGVLALFLTVTLIFSRLSTEQTATEDLPWDYPGDVHEVVDLEGVGPTYAGRLHDAGIFNTQTLLFTPDEDVARITKANPKTVTGWKSMSQLIKVRGIGPQYAEALVRGGVTGGIDALRTCNVQETTDKVNIYLESLEATVVGHLISDKRMTKWQAAALKMDKVPIDLTKLNVRKLQSKEARKDESAGDNPAVNAN
jgi:predicted flap endonuclease-1-like 5' DNA nuclease